MTDEEILIIDLEMTCCEDGSFPKDEMEIIQIGAVKMSPINFEITSFCMSFVRPILHPNLSSFCKDLTGISQGTVDASQPFGTMSAV